MNVYFLITSCIYVLHIIIVIPHSVDGMVLQDGALSHLDILIQKSMRYKHHKENYIKSWRRYCAIGITNKGKTSLENQLENKHANFRKVLEKRRSKKWQKFKTATKSRIQSNIALTEKVTESRDSIKISSKQSGNYPNNGHNILTSREGSSKLI